MAVRIYNGHKPDFFGIYIFGYFRVGSVIVNKVIQDVKCGFGTDRLAGMMGTKIVNSRLIFLNIYIVRKFYCPNVVLVIFIISIGSFIILFPTAIANIYEFTDFRVVGSNLL